MKFDEIEKIVSNVSYTKKDRAKILYDFIVANEIETILELGFAHGASTCYMSGALEEKLHEGKLKGAKIVTIDNQDAKKLQPGIHDLLKMTNLSNLVEVKFAFRTYVWELMKMLQRNEEMHISNEQFDFCFIDGHHSWEVDGFAFFLVDKMLKPGGWILFDDLLWTFSTMPRDHEYIKQLSEEELNTPQIEKVVNLLVKTHPNYSQLTIRDGWAWIRKTSSSQVDKNNSVNNIYEQQGILTDVTSILRKLKRSFKS